MICLEKMDIGGVETFVVNQITALLKKNINVVVLAKHGIYTDVLKEMKVKVINHDFNLENNINVQDVKKAYCIIKENNITQVYINQFPCINTIVPACLMAKIPYVAYVHSTLKAFENENINENVYEWYKYHFPIFAFLFSIYFKYASKIVTITLDSKNYLMQKFNLSESNIVVIPNSINFEKYKSENDIKKIKKILLVSRLSSEKIDSIKSALKLFQVLTVNSNKYELKIVGDGDKRYYVEKLVEELNIKENVIFVGAVSNVDYYIQNSDAVIGVDRCILEAIAMKRLAIISSYNGCLDIVTPENLDLYINENFSGKSIENSNVNKFSKIIDNLKIKDALSIVNRNYNLIKNKLDINKNIFMLEDNIEFLIDDFYIDFIILLNNIFLEKSNLQLEYNELLNKHKILEEDRKNIIENKNNLIKQKQEEIDKLNIKLQSIYSSRSYKYINKLKTLIKKK